MADYSQLTVVQLKQEIDRREKLDKTASNETNEIKMETDIILKVEDMDPDEKLLDEPKEDDSGFWFELYKWNEENADGIVDKLGRLNLLIANALVYKDFAHDRDWKTATLEPITTSNMAMPSLSPLAQQCIRYNLHMQPNDKGVMTGYAKLFFKKRMDLERNLARLKAVSPNLVVDYIQDFAEFTEKKASLDFFKIKNSAEDSATAIRKDDVTLFTPSVTDEMTEDDLWRIFPEAHYIILSKQPFCHAYIQFDCEDKMLKKVELLKSQESPPEPFTRLRMMVLSDSRKGFQLHHSKNIRSKKKKRPANAGSGAATALPGRPSPQPQQRPASVSSPQPVSGSQGLSPGTAGSDIDTEGMSKSKIRRMKAKRKKELAKQNETSDQSGFQSQFQLPQQGQPQQGQPQQSLGAGINLLLQTLGNLAQAGQGMNPIDQLQKQLVQMGQGQGQLAQGPGPAKKKKNKKRKKTSGDGAGNLSTDVTMSAPQAQGGDRGTLQSPTPSGTGQPSAAKRKRMNQKKKIQQQKYTTNTSRHTGDVFSTENYTADSFGNDSGSFYIDRVPSSVGNSGGQTSRGYGGTGSSTSYGSSMYSSRSTSGYGGTGSTYSNGGSYSSNSSTNQQTIQRLQSLASANSNTNYY